MAKAYSEYVSARVSELITLTPARTDTAWFGHVWSAEALCFVRGRINFKGSTSTNTAPSVFGYWGPMFAGLEVA
jgi:hypothetical protein